MTQRATAVVALILLALLLALRTFVSGWGPPAEPPATASTTFGVTAYPADNLSYSAWAQQSRLGLWRFGILYTTTEHERLMFNSLFLLVGRVAALLAVSPLLVLNVLAVSSLPVFILSVSSICRGLGLGTAATFAATCLAIGGGGISWIRKAVEWSGLHRVLPVGEAGPDLSYYDVYPVVAYVVAPYHSIALAVVAIVVLLIVRFDDHQNRLTPMKAALLFGAALLLATARPHISILILAAYCAAAGATMGSGGPWMVAKRRLVVAACLAVATLPAVLYAVWVSRQPVWRSFSEAHPAATHDWTIGFFALWVLAGIGVGLLDRRAWRSPLVFLLAWAAAAGVLLLVLNGYLNPKLTGGSTMALGVLAGVAVDIWWNRVRSRLVSSAVMVVIVLAALASPAVFIVRSTQQRTTAASELFQVIETIRNDAAAPFPTVLADCGTGVMLPGLGGYRVFCGHWALTENNRQRIVLLSRLGLVAEGQSVPSFPGVGDHELAAVAALLREQIAADTFQYLVLRTTHRIHREFQPMASRCALHSGSHYLVLRMCPEVKSTLDQKLRA